MALQDAQSKKQKENTKKQIQSELKHEEKKNTRTAKKEQISEEKRRRVCAPLCH
jgi:hypothetical protein